MSSNYGKNFNTKKTSQRSNVPGKKQVKNNEGGYVFKANTWDLLDRFLILGSDENTYYASAHTMTQDNAKNIIKLIEKNGTGVVDRIVEISSSGRAPKNDPALFALALCCAPDFADEATRSYAFGKLSSIARIPTHLYTFNEFLNGFRGWGRARKTAVGNWFLENKNLEYHAIKYRQRNGWSMRDLLRLSHPVPQTDSQDAIFHWVTQGEIRKGADIKIIEGYEKLQKAGTAKKAATLIKTYNLPHETIPTELKNSPEVWEAMLPNLPITAAIRNLGNMTRYGVLKPMSDNTKQIVSKLTDEETLRNGRVHPLSLLVALNTYKLGHGIRGGNHWEPVPQIVAALNDAFYKSFDFVEPSGKRTLLGLDVSSSMTWNDLAGMPGITPSVGAAAMAMVTARTEEDYHIMGFADTLRSLGISSKDTLDSAIAKTERMSFGGTDCSLPMRWASENNVDVDTFVVYTDSQTYAGCNHPFQALNDYRQKTGIPAKLVVVCMEANEFTIADPSDKGMLDVVGFDTAAPNIISGFSREDM